MMSLTVRDPDDKKPSGTAPEMLVDVGLQLGPLSESQSLPEGSGSFLTRNRDSRKMRSRRYSTTLPAMSGGKFNIQFASFTTSNSASMELDTLFPEHNMGIED